MQKKNAVVSVFRLCPVRAGGIECFARELSLQLAEKDWQSILVFPAPPSGEAVNLLDLPNVVIKIIKECGELSPKSAWQFLNLLHEFQPKIVHLHFIDGWSGYPWLAKLYNVKTILMTDHNSRSPGYVAEHPKLWKLLLHRIVHSPITKCICVSKYIQNCVISEGIIPEQKVLLIYNGVDIDRATNGNAQRSNFRKRHFISDEDILVLQVSWLIPEKGIDDFILAAQQVTKTTKSIRFIIAGNGSRQNDYQLLTKKINIDNMVSFIGVVNDPLGEGLFAACDIFCQVSRWEEAFGLTIAEAMAAARPVIGTRVGGIPELVQDEETGCLVKRGDSNGLAIAIEKLANNTKIRLKMGRAGHNRCQAMFNLTINVAEHLKEYNI
jgi:glycosyltransferase involved in cell wall biosynthesis